MTKDIILAMIGCGLVMLGGFIIGCEVGKNKQSPLPAPAIATVQWVPTKDWQSRGDTGGLRRIEFGFRGDGALLWRLGAEVTP